jgi:murein DD-endopeptidase MepM/ murein hydrolase activator NlpD
LGRLLSWWHKRFAVHAGLFGLMAALALQSQAVNLLSRDTLLYSLFAGEEVTEGPLDPSSYAEVNAPGIGGARLGVVEAGVGLDIITFDDPEVAFAATLGGNVLVAPLTPLPAEDLPAGQTGLAQEGLTTPKPRIYTIQPGDTLASIAEDNGLAVTTLQASNGLGSSATIKPGDHLTILPLDGVMHTVTSGDTVFALALKYDVTSEEIANYNSLGDDGKLSLGQKLIIPGGKIPVATTRRLANQPAPSSPDATPDPKPSSVPSAGQGWQWPTTTTHLSQGFRWGHTGIDIDNRSRPAIYAALSGTVEFAGWLGGYGNLLIVNHGNGIQTYYAHLQNMYVGKGSTVAKGEAIAKMGSTGRSTGPHLHFEVRRNGQPINPLGMF